MSASTQQAQRRGRLLLVVTAIVAVVVIFVALERRAAHRALLPPAKPVPVRSAAPPSPVNPAPAAAANVSPNGEEPSHLVDDLNAPTKDIHSDLRLLNELFDQYRSAVHGPNPVGENAEIVAALAGKNKLGYSFLPPHHPAINADGQLVDRWGMPFFFHQLSADQMQIRSAGPDRKMYTDDDQVITPGLSQPHL